MPGKGSIVERNGKFYLKISITEDGKNRQKWLPLKAKNRSMAEKERDKIWVDREREQWVEPKKETVNDLYVRWIKHLKNRPKPAGRRTIIEYQRIYENHIKEHLGHIKFQKLKTKPIRELIELKDTPHKARRTYDVLNAVFNLAIRDGDTGVKDNPCAGIEPPPLEKRDPTVWNAEQCKKFLIQVKDNRYYGLFLMSMTTAMRIGEVIGIRWQDIDLKNKKINVEQKLELKEPGDSSIQIGKPKTKASKAGLLMTDVLAEELEKVKQRQKLERKGYREKYQNLDFVFRNTVGGPVILEDLRDRVFNPAIEKAEVPKIRIHDMRHSAATLLLSLGVDIRIVQRYLRHADLSATQIYVHDDDVELLRDATQKMNEALRI